MDLILLMNDAHKNLKLYFLLNTKVSGLPKVLWFNNDTQFLSYEEFKCKSLSKRKGKSVGRLVVLILPKYDYNSSSIL